MGLTYLLPAMRITDSQKGGFMKSIKKMFLGAVFTGIALASLSSETVPKGFVKVPGVTVKGTENWTPFSKIFVKGRSLKIESFYMCDHEVTQSEYKDILGASYSSSEHKMADTEGQPGNNPVNSVSWYEAVAYCNLRSIKEGLKPCYTVSGSTNPDGWAAGDLDSVKCDFTANGYRLPAETEWEWAARGGKEFIYSGSDNIDDVAWCKTNSDYITHEVKTKKANGYGLYDMSGNVWEWCWDWHDEVAGDTALTGPASGAFRVRRGGSWYVNAILTAVSLRDFVSPSLNNDSLGFRVVRSAL